MNTSGRAIGNHPRDFLSPEVCQDARTTSEGLNGCCVYLPHVIFGETEAQKGQVMFPVFTQLLAGTLARLGDRAPGS